MNKKIFFMIFTVLLFFHSPSYSQSWEQVNLDGFGDSNNKELGFEIYNNCLYAGTDNRSTGCEVWRYNSGTSWTQIKRMVSETQTM